MAGKMMVVHHKASRKATVVPTEDKRILKAAAYCRVSTMMDEQESSFETQRDYYTKLIDSRNGMENVGIYADRGFSGLRADSRPELQRLLRDCRNGKVDVVFVKSVSRLSRNLSECIGMVTELRSLGVGIIFEKENIDTLNHTNELYLNILSAMAQEESNSISQNIRWAHEMRARGGDPIRGGRYGYRRHKGKGGTASTWEIVEEEAERIRLIYSLALERKCYVEIREALDELEEEKGTGVRWTFFRIRHALTDVIYKGDLYPGEHYVADYLHGKTVKNRGEKPRYYIEDHHEAIVSKEDFDKVQILVQSHALDSYAFLAERRRKG